MLKLKPDDILQKSYIWQRLTNKFKIHIKQVLVEQLDKKTGLRLYLYFFCFWNESQNEINENSTIYLISYALKIITKNDKMQHIIHIGKNKWIIQHFFTFYRCNKIWQYAKSMLLSWSTWKNYTIKTLNEKTKIYF